MEEKTIYDMIRNELARANEMTKEMTKATPEQMETKDFKENYQTTCPYAKRLDLDAMMEKSFQHGLEKARNIATNAAPLAMLIGATTCIVAGVYDGYTGFHATEALFQYAPYGALTVAGGGFLVTNKGRDQKDIDRKVKLDAFITGPAISLVLYQTGRCLGLVNRALLG